MGRGQGRGHAAERAWRRARWRLAGVRPERGRGQAMSEAKGGPRGLPGHQKLKALGEEGLGYARRREGLIKLVKFRWPCSAWDKHGQLKPSLLGYSLAPKPNGYALRDGFRAVKDMAAWRSRRRRIDTEPLARPEGACPMSDAAKPEVYCRTESADAAHAGAAARLRGRAWSGLSCPLRR
jgi:hypothetical protein